MLVSKYADHLPLYRQAQIYARQSVNLDRSTMGDWLGHAAWHLRPLHQRLLDKLKARPKLFADETTLLVLDPGRGRTETGQLWAYAADDRLWNGSVRRAWPMSTAQTARLSGRSCISKASKASCRWTAMPATAGWPSVATCSSRFAGFMCGVTLQARHPRSCADFKRSASAHRRAVCNPIKLNRKNALFAGSDGGAEHWATIAPLIETCKLNDIDTLGYLTDVLAKIANGHPNRDIDALLPWAYRKQDLSAVARGRRLRSCLDQTSLYGVQICGADAVNISSCYVGSNNTSAQSDSVLKILPARILLCHPTRSGSSLLV